MRRPKKNDLKRRTKAEVQRAALARRIDLRPNANDGGVAMLGPRETATILASLLYWREEMSPHGSAIMRPYFQHFRLTHIKPLITDEIEQLCDRLRETIPKRS